jgi:hypothetical protein
MEFFSGIEVFDKITTVGVLFVVAVAVITDKLVWHTRLKKETERADRWEAVALEALTAGAQAGVKAAETTVELVSALPPDKSRE